MKYFTNNPLERQMMQAPTGRVKPDPAPAVPENHPCHGCKRRDEGNCVLPCYRGVKALPSR